MALVPNLANAATSRQAELDSFDLDDLVGAINGTGCVSGCGATTNATMTITIASGVVRIGGQWITVAGNSVTIGTANATNPRSDLIAINSSGTAVVLAGTAASDPAYAWTDGNWATYCPLYGVDVPAGTTALTSSQLTDKRINPGPIPNVIAALPTGVTATDTAAVQTAISNSNIGDTIYFQRGTYVVTPPIVYQGWRQYVGVGAGANTTIQAAPTLLNNSLTGVFEPYNYTNNQTFADQPVIFENIKFDGNTGIRTLFDFVTNGTTTITSATANFDTVLDVGATIAQPNNTNIAAATTILSVTNSTTAVLSAAPSAASGVQATITRTAAKANIAGWSFVGMNYWSVWRDCEFIGGPSGGFLYTDKGKSVGRTSSADAHLTNGSNIITSATAAFVQGDKGNVITSSAAGLAGGTTITSVDSSTQVHVSNNFTGTTTTTATLTLASPTIVNTCVESRWEDCRFQFNGGPGFQTDNYAGGCTDGFLLHNQFNTNGFAVSGGASTINLNKAAGWCIDGNNLYVCALHAINAVSCYGTTICNHYIEDWGTMGMGSGPDQCGIQAQLVAGRHTQIHNNNLFVTTTPNASAHYTGIQVYATAANTFVKVNDNLIQMTNAATTRSAVNISYLAGGETIFAVVSGNMAILTPLGKELVVPDSTVTMMPFVVGGDLWLGAHGHLVAHRANDGVTTALAATAGANAGTTPPAPVVTGCTDVRGNPTFGTGTTPAAGAMIAVTFGTTYANSVVPIVVVTPRNSATAALNLYVSAQSTTGFTVSCVTAPTASQANTVYSFDYMVIG